jgi:tRNA(adenine34) deaminase
MTVQRREGVVLSATADIEWMRRAIRLAQLADRLGTLPVASVIVLDGVLVAEAFDGVLFPSTHPGRHAVMAALREVPLPAWRRASEMTCYCTLEPCVMCLGALLIHGIGRVAFGAKDPYAGALHVLEHLPPATAEQATSLVRTGPILPRACGALYRRVLARSMSPSLSPDVTPFTPAQRRALAPPPGPASIRAL